MVRSLSSHRAIRCSYSLERREVIRVATSVHLHALPLQGKSDPQLLQFLFCGKESCDAWCFNFSFLQHFACGKGVLRCLVPKCSVAVNNLRVGVTACVVLIKFMCIHSLWPSLRRKAPVGLLPSAIGRICLPAVMSAVMCLLCGDECKTGVWFEGVATRSTCA